MPLKHSTETWLVVFLGIAIMVAGIACAVLPALTYAPLLWAILFALSIAYPLSLYPLFKERRADYEFRMLHFVPAGMLVLWLLLQLLTLAIPAVAILTSFFVWGWSLPLVILSFAALTWFCLHVIRQRQQRLTFLAVALALFLGIAIAGETFKWPEQIASILSGSSSSTSSVPVIAGADSSAGSSNLGKSDDPSEEKLRVTLRRMERRKERLAELADDPLVVRGAIDGVLMASSQGSVIAAVPSKTTPPHLTSSGMETQAFILAVIALYCGLLHQRAKNRNNQYA